MVSARKQLLNNETKRKERCSKPKKNYVRNNPMERNVKHKHTQNVSLKRNLPAINISADLFPSIRRQTGIVFIVVVRRPLSRDVAATHPKQSHFRCPAERGNAETLRRNHALPLIFLGDTSLGCLPATKRCRSLSHAKAERLPTRLIGPCVGQTNWANQPSTFD